MKYVLKFYLNVLCRIDDTYTNQSIKTFGRIIFVITCLIKLAIVHVAFDFFMLT